MIVPVITLSKNNVSLIFSPLKLPQALNGFGHTDVLSIDFIRARTTPNCSTCCPSTHYLYEAPDFVFQIYGHLKQNLKVIGYNWAVYGSQRLRIEFAKLGLYLHFKLQEHVHRKG